MRWSATQRKRDACGAAGERIKGPSKIFLGGVNPHRLQHTGERAMEALGRSRRASRVGGRLEGGIYLWVLVVVVVVVMEKQVIKRR